MLAAKETCFTSPKVCSLADWPVTTLHGQKIRLSPFTRRLIKQSNLKVQELLPISIDQFASRYDLTLSMSSIQQQYEVDQSHRAAKLKILTEMRSELIQRGCTNAHSKYMKDFKRYQSELEDAVSLKVKQKTYSRDGSVKKQRSFFSKPNRLSMDRSEKSLEACGLISNYYEEIGNACNSPKQRNSQIVFRSAKKSNGIQNISDNVKKELVSALSMCKKLNEIQMGEIVRMRQRLNSKEKKRLLKMHLIERTELEEKIRKLKKNMIQG